MTAGIAFYVAPGQTCILHSTMNTPRLESVHTYLLHHAVVHPAL
jgi:hypothetical protein